MWPHERHAQILEMLDADGKVLTNVLAGLFAVSRETVRRDLLNMERGGTLQRVHGGAVASAKGFAPEPAFAERLQTDADTKLAIGQKAAALIPSGATILVDAGTTTLAFAQMLAQRDDIRIITNSIEIAQTPGVVERCEVLLLGGRPHRDVPGTFGEITLSEIDRFLADFAVLSPVGVHAERGLTDYDLNEAEVARKMMQRSRQTVILCHSAKFGVESRVSICRMDEIDHLVTDTRPDAYFALPRGRIHLSD